LAESDLKAVSESREWNKGYKDYKWLLTGNNASSPIQFKVNVSVDNSSMMICSLHGNWGKLPQGMVELNSNSTRIEVDSVKIGFKRVQYGDCYKLQGKFQSGLRNLTITALTEKRISISHLIWQ
jgi:hypothetical protein